MFRGKLVRHLAGLGVHRTSIESPGRSEYPFAGDHVHHRQLEAVDAEVAIKQRKQTIDFSIIVTHDRMDHFGEKPEKGIIWAAQ